MFFGLLLLLVVMALVVATVGVMLTFYFGDIFCFRVFEAYHRPLVSAVFFCIFGVVMDLMSFAAVVVACCCCSCSVFRCAYHSTLHVQAARQSSRPPPHPLIPPPPIPAPLLPPPSLPSPRLSSPSSRHPPPTPPPLLSYPVQLPSKLKAPTPGEVEAAKLNVSLGRALENNTALAEAVRSKDDLVKDLNSRIKQVREPRVFFVCSCHCSLCCFCSCVFLFCIPRTVVGQQHGSARIRVQTAV